MGDGSFIYKLLEEDEDESNHSGVDIDALEATLSRDIQGNDGFGDANTNLHRQHHILESTEQQPSVLENQSHLQHNPPQDRLQLDQLWENPSHIPQPSKLQSRNSTIGNEPETPLKLPKFNSQQADGMKQPVAPVNHGPTRAQISEFCNILLTQVDENTKTQLYVCKPLTRLEKCCITELSRKGNVRIKAPGCPSYDRVSFTSPEINAQKCDPQGVHVTVQGLNKHPQLDNQGSTGVERPIKATINMTNVPNFEKPTSVNAPLRVQDAHLQNNSSLPPCSTTWLGSVTKDQKVDSSPSVVHVKQVDQGFRQAQKPLSLVQQAVPKIPMNQNYGNPRRSNDDDSEKPSSKMVFSTSTTNASFVSPSVTTQLGSRGMVNLPVPSRLIQAGANVSTTPKMPYVGHKKPLGTLGSSLSPSRKKQKICPNSSSQSIEQLNDVTAGSGINLKEEEEQLLLSRKKKDGRVSEVCRRVVHEEEERTILQKIPLQRKLIEIMAKSGLKHMGDGVERCLSLCVEERMRGLFSNIIRVSKQRTDAEKSRNRTFVTSDIRKQINEMNQKMKEECERKERKNGENNTEKEANHSKQVKENKEEEAKRNKEEGDKMRAKANVAARAAFGGDDAFSKWKRMAESHQKPSSGSGRNSKKPYAETVGRRFGKNQGLSNVDRSISVKDVIAVVEKEPQISKSTLLYRLCNRICSDVQTEEKT